MYYLIFLVLVFKKSVSRNLMVHVLTPPPPPSSMSAADEMDSHSIAERCLEHQHLIHNVELMQLHDAITLIVMFFFFFLECHLKTLHIMNTCYVGDNHSK